MADARVRVKVELDRRVSAAAAVAVGGVVAVLMFAGGALFGVHLDQDQYFVRPDVPVSTPSTTVPVIAEVGE